MASAVSTRINRGYWASFIFAIFEFENLIFWLLIGLGQYFERLWLIRVEAAEAIMHLNDVFVAYDNWFWLTPKFLCQNLKKLDTPTVVDSERRTFSN